LTLRGKHYRKTRYYGKKDKRYTKANIWKWIRQKAAFLLQFIVTVGIWAVFIAAFVWILGAVGWYLIATLWLKELFISNEVYSTVLTAFAVLLWATLLLVIALLWARYNYRHYYLHNKRKLLPIKMDVPPIPWEEILWDNSIAVKITTASEPEDSRNKSAVLEQLPALRSSESSSIQNLIMTSSFRNKRGQIVLSAGEKVTEEKLTEICHSGLYVEFVSVLSKQLSSKVKQ
jgi:hypothetical protein